MPDGFVSSSSNFMQVVDQGHDTQLSVTSGCTVVFDSYSAEHEVHRRNLKRNNVSKLNHMPSRFSTDFNVCIHTDSVAAILCAETVSDYRVVDKKRSGQSIAAIDKQSDYIKTPHEISAKRMRSEPSLETNNALIEQEDSGQTCCSAPCMTALPLRNALNTGNEEKQAPCPSYNSPHPISCAISDSGFPRCILVSPAAYCTARYIR